MVRARRWRHRWRRAFSSGEDGTRPPAACACRRPGAVAPLLPPFDTLGTRHYYLHGLAGSGNQNCF